MSWSSLFKVTLVNIDVCVWTCKSIRICELARPLFRTPNILLLQLLKICKKKKEWFSITLTMHCLIKSQRNGKVRSDWLQKEFCVKLRYNTSHYDYTKHPIDSNSQYIWGPFVPAIIARVTIFKIQLTMKDNTYFQYPTKSPISAKVRNHHLQRN